MSTPKTRAMVEICRDEMTMHGVILEALGDEERTVPALAEATSLPVSEVMVWVMGMRRYGWLREIKGSESDGYFRYQAEERA